SLELQLVDVAALVRDREVETRVPAGAIHPAGVHARDAVLASAATERHRGDRAAVEVGAHGHGFVEGFTAHVRVRHPGRGGCPRVAVACSGRDPSACGPYCTDVQ